MRKLSSNYIQILPKLLVFRPLKDANVEELYKNKNNWKEEMKNGKLTFEPHGDQKAISVFDDETETIEAVVNEPPMKKKRFCCF